MAHSRFSIPLFSVALLVIAVCMSYLVVTKNIFGLASLSNGEATEASPHADESVVAADGSEISNGSFFDIKKIKRVIATGTKKVTGSQEVAEQENAETESAKNSGAASVNETSKAGAETNTKVILGYAPSAMSQRDYEIRLLWQKYSATLPRLYSHPVDERTEEILGRVGQLSMQLDSQGYNVQSESELIKIAVAGEREGARALSFQNMNPSLNNTTQALSWALIANAIAPNDYYLYICSAGFPECTESLFLQAAMQAQKYINLYGFSQVQRQ